MPCDYGNFHGVDDITRPGEMKEFFRSIDVFPTRSGDAFARQAGYWLLSSGFKATPARRTAGPPASGRPAFERRLPV
jgi:hypothetical protein